MRCFCHLCTKFQAKFLHHHDKLLPTTSTNFSLPRQFSPLNFPQSQLNFPAKFLRKHNETATKIVRIFHKIQLIATQKSLQNCSFNTAWLLKIKAEIAFKLCPNSTNFKQNFFANFFIIKRFGISNFGRILVTNAVCYRTKIWPESQSKNQAIFANF